MSSNIDVEKYLPLVKKIVLKIIGKTGVPIEDTEEYSIGCEALISARGSYCPSKGAFATHARTLIRNKVLDYKKYQRVRFSVQDEYNLMRIPDSNDSELDFLDAGWSDEEKIDLQILISNKVENISIAQIAKQYHLSRPTIYSRINKIIEKIQKKIA